MAAFKVSTDGVSRVSATIKGMSGRTSSTIFQRILGVADDALREARLFSTYFVDVKSWNC